MRDELPFQRKPVRLTELAELDLASAQDFYAPKGEWILEHFLASIDEAMEKLSFFAGIHRVCYGHHRMAVPHFPFSIYYDLEDGVVVVKAVLDDRFGPARIAAHFGTYS